MYVTIQVGELLPRLSILTLAGGLFLLHFPGSRLRLTLSAILPYEARTFLTVIPFGVIPRDRLARLHVIITFERKKVNINAENVQFYNQQHPCDLLIYEKTCFFVLSMLYFNKEGDF